MSSTPGAVARVAVMGSGSWGTAFALVLSDAGNDVTLWARRPELAAVINSEHRNADYFPTIALPEALRAVSDPQAAMDGADFVVLAVPSQSCGPTSRPGRSRRTPSWSAWPKASSSAPGCG